METLLVVVTETLAALVVVVMPMVMALAAHQRKLILAAQLDMVKAVALVETMEHFILLAVVVGLMRQAAQEWHQQQVVMAATA